MKLYYKKNILWLFLCSVFFLLLGCNQGSSPANSSGQITAYSLNGIPGKINGHNILVKIPSSFDKTKLKVAFKTNGVSVKVGETLLVSGETLLDFTKPVSHSVISTDGSITTYTVTVTPLFICVADGENQCGCLLQDDGSGLMWYGSTLIKGNGSYPFSEESDALAVFNSGHGHCGYNNWRIPTLSTLDNKNYYFGSSSNEINAATDFGMLGNYAILNGYQSESNLNIWLNSQGFNLIPNAVYWSSSVYAPYPNDGAWMLNMTNGRVEAKATQKGLNADLLPVTTTPTKRILSYSLNGVPGTINGESIAVTVPFGSNVESLVATFITNAASVSVESTVQVSGITLNNFTNPVVYTVTSLDGSSKNYTVTVTMGDAITSFSLTGREYIPLPDGGGFWIKDTDDGIINFNSWIWVATECTDVSNLIATYNKTLPGVTVTVGGVTQVNGVTPNNFTNPVVYTVSAANGSFQSYTVTVFSGFVKNK